jgi:hypothetical protein
VEWTVSFTCIAMIWPAGGILSMTRLCWEFGRLLRRDTGVETGTAAAKMNARQSYRRLATIRANAPGAQPNRLRNAVLNALADS